MFSQLRPAIVSFALLTALTGVVYPLAVTVAGKGLFPSKADGSLVRANGHVVGSSLLGQPFDDPKYFWSRPSGTTPPYNGGASTGSNLGPTNPALVDAVKGRIAALRDADPDNDAPIPIDLVTTSGSGLDPHIRPAAAFYQAGRVARKRGLDESRVRQLVQSHVEPPDLGILGEPRVNVLALNLALDGLR